MIPIKIAVTVEWPFDGSRGGASIRAWKRIMTKAHSEQGDYWHSKILPRSFTRSARARRKHKQRTGKYLKFKQAMARRGARLRGGGTVQKSGRVDNVFSGEMAQRLQAVGTVRAFPSRVSISMTGPRYITMRPFKSNQPDKAAEITSVTSDEASKLARIMEVSIAKQLKTLPKRSRKKVKV